MEEPVSAAPEGAVSRFRELRRLVLPAGALFLAGSALGWWAREPLSAWLVGIAGRPSILEATSPPAWSRALALMAAGVGFVLALPLVGWGLCSVVAPVTVGRARHRFGAYLASSFVAVVLANPLPLVLLLAPKESPADAATPEQVFFITLRRDEFLLQIVEALGVWALGGALVIPVFVLARHHPSSVQRGYSMGASALLLAGLLMLAHAVSYETHLVTRGVAKVTLVGTLLAVPIAVLLRYGFFKQRGGLATAVSGLGLAGLVFAERWLVDVVPPFGAGLALLYGIAGGLGLVLWNAAERPA